MEIWLGLLAALIITGGVMDWRARRHRRKLSVSGAEVRDARIRNDARMSQLGPNPLRDQGNFPGF